jgi:outer membrane protein, adhesin transport system
MKLFGHFLKSVGAISAILGISFVPGQVFADEFPEMVAELLSTDKNILAAKADVAGAAESAKAAWGEWYPDLDVTSHYGYEKQNKPYAANTSAPTRYLNMKITQQLWDFGSSNSIIHQANLTLAQAQATLEQAKQTLLLDAATAYLGLIKAEKIVKFAEGSVGNIKRQAELESSTVRRGGGIAKDVLQAKTQLAVAESRLVQSKGGLKNALNRYIRVFGHRPDPASDLLPPRLPTHLLPNSLEDALAVAVKENPQIKSASLTAQIAKEKISQSNADGLYPKLNLVAGTSMKEDYSGTLGWKAEHIVKVELTYNLDMGMTAVNTLRATEHAQGAATSRYGSTREDVEEAVRNAWDDHETATSNLAQLKNLANISGEFLELARRARQIGEGTLIDVLAGETTLINANSDAAAAESDVAIAAYTLLSTMGQLDEKGFQVGKP